jgi:hypothetical protein
MPLTGLPIEDPAVTTRSALVVKIDNHPDARPQSGLNQADIVYEENVEHLTRFAAVFQTNAPDPVGPIAAVVRRMSSYSGRSTSRSLRGRWPRRHQGHQQLGLHRRQRADQRRAASQSFRSRDNAAPHNLYAMGSGLFTITRFPRAAQIHRRPMRPSTALPPVASVEDGRVNVSWKYDAKTGKYLRFQWQGAQRHSARPGQLRQRRRSGRRRRPVRSAQSQRHRPPEPARSSSSAATRCCTVSGPVLTVSCHALTADSGNPIC